MRVLRGALWSLRQKGFGRTIKAFWRDLKRDFTANRVRRLGQAFAMARELPAEVRHLHVHYLHTPASVVRYAALLTGRTWTFSAHAKDIWTTPDWEKREKMAEALWGVTCTAQGAEHLQSLSRPEHVSLVYHGLDLSRFPTPPESRPARDGSDPLDPLRIVSIGRAVAKKGFGDLIQALAALPPGPALALRPCGRRRIAQQPQEAGTGRGHGQQGHVPRLQAAAGDRRAPAGGGPLRPAVEGSEIGRSGRPAERDHGSGKPGARHRGDGLRGHSGIHPQRRRGRARAAGRLGGSVERSQSSRPRPGPPRGPRRCRLSRACGGSFPWRAASTCSKRASGP